MFGLALADGRRLELPSHDFVSGAVAGPYGHGDGRHHEYLESVPGERRGQAARITGVKVVVDGGVGLSLFPGDAQPKALEIFADSGNPATNWR